MYIHIPDATIVDAFKLAYVGEYYKVDLAGIYSDYPCEWGIVSGSLPEGLNLSGSDYDSQNYTCKVSVSGTPTKLVSNSFRLRVYTDYSKYSVSLIGEKDFSINVYNYNKPELQTPPANTSGRHSRGTVVVDKKVVYFLGADMRYPYPSMDVFKSWGHTAKEIVKANSGDLAIPIGAVVGLNYLPIGHYDELKDGYISGWAFDKNQLTAPLNVQAFFDAPKGTPSSANSTGIFRPDVNDKYGISVNAGFQIYVPDSLYDGKQHSFYLYAYDPDDPNLELKVTLAGPVKFRLDPITGPKIIQFTVSPSDFYSGEFVVLVWQVTPAQSIVNIPGVIVNGAASGKTYVYPEISTSYTLTASFGKENASQTVYVWAKDKVPVKPTIAYFDSLAGSTIKQGVSVTIDWSTSDADTVTFDNAPVEKKGSKKVSPAATTTYTLVAANSSGSVSKQYTINVEKPESDMVVRDNQRYKDITGIVLGLASYYEDKSRHTFPSNLQILVPNYLINIPQPPAQPASPCLGSDNSYVYTPNFDLTNSTLRFCFETDTYGSVDPLLKAGIHTLDFLKEMQSNEEKSNDAQRVAEIHNLQTGLELFYNDNNRYPSSVGGLPISNDGNPAWSSYISKFPVAPTPPGGACSPAQNNYTYTPVGDNNYQLTFCLGVGVSSYGSGYHTATASGIQ